MKKVLFVIPSFAIGGVTSSLQSLLSVLDKEVVEADLFCRQKEGPMKEAYPGNRILSENIWLSSQIVEGGWIKKTLCLVLRMLRGVLGKIGIDLHPLYGKIGGKQLQTMQYDTVISFHEGLSSIVCYYPAKKHIAWIHCDYGRYQTMVKKDELKHYELYDNIVCVSEFARSVFCSIYPSLKGKTRAIHNIINVESICVKSKEKEGLDTRFDNSIMDVVSRPHSIHMEFDILSDHNFVTNSYFGLGKEEYIIIIPYNDESTFLYNKWREAYLDWYGGNLEKEKLRFRNYNLFNINNNE